MIAQEPKFHKKTYETYASYGRYIHYLNYGGGLWGCINMSKH
jgi:hypothetical protein